MYEWVPQRCPICDKPPTKYLGRRGGGAHREQLGVETRVWRCSKCGLTFPNPMPIPVRGLDQHYAVSPDSYFEHHETELRTKGAFSLLTQAEALVGGKGTLLDIGSGRGELLHAGVELGWKVIGIEPSTTFATHAATLSGAEVRREPVEQCGFPSSAFDVVILAAVLEHLYNPDETIKEISRILRPGGALFLDVPNERGLYFVLGNLYQKMRGRDWVVNLAPTFSPYHVFGFSPKSLRSLLSKHCLRPELWQMYAGTSFVPARTGVVSLLERQAAKAVTAISNVGSLGAYIETWAIKESDKAKV
jgi:2-polyprenyl-3-methyl-5-hydroxy-6-metoxy-1,4-benzoquinol methylase